VDLALQAYLRSAVPVPVISSNPSIEMAYTGVEFAHMESPDVELQETNLPCMDNSNEDLPDDNDLPKRKALKEEYASPEWISWREGNRKGLRPDLPVE
jgi:hypothetical protein